METLHPELLNTWVSNWKDLIDFEIVPVLTSADFWAKKHLEQNGQWVTVPSLGGGS